MRQRESEFSMSQASCASTSFLPDFYRPAPDGPGRPRALGTPEHHQCSSDLICWISSDADGRRLHFFKTVEAGVPRLAGSIPVRLRYQPRRRCGATVRERASRRDDFEF